jgi:hypothetical protein
MPVHSKLNLVVRVDPSRHGFIQMNDFWITSADRLVFNTRTGWIHEITGFFKGGQASFIRVNDKDKIREGDLLTVLT